MNELQFDADEWIEMTPAQRAGRCLLFAEQARALSLSASAEVKQAYEDLSRHWLALADEIEGLNDDREEATDHPN